LKATNFWLRRKVGHDLTATRKLGMMTFDVSLFELYDEGAITYDEAIRNADSANELRLNIKLNSKRGTPGPALQVVAG
jgi:twitching motility protein PilU